MIQGAQPRDKALQLIQQLGMAFSEPPMSDTFPIFTKTYRDLTARGIHFRPEAEVEPIFSSPAAGVASSGAGPAAAEPTTGQPISDEEFARRLQQVRAKHYPHAFALVSMTRALVTQRTSLH